MAIETLDDIITEMADRIGVYGACEGASESSGMYHCRICFEMGLRDRIKAPMRVERIHGAIERLERMADSQSDASDVAPGK
jgi:hypothetical protein